MKIWKKRFLASCGVALCLSTLPAQLVLADSPASASASGNTSGTTDVVVEFTNANIYIERMPNLDFGTGHSLIDDKSKAINLFAGNAKTRSLIVNSANADVPFSVTLKGGTPYLWDPDTSSEVDANNIFTDTYIAKLTFTKPSTPVKDADPIKVGRPADSTKEDNSINWNPVDKESSATISGESLYLGIFGTPTNSSVKSDPITFLDVTSENATYPKQGLYGVNLKGKDSAKLNFSSEALEQLRTYTINDTGKLNGGVGNNKNKHLNIVFPLQWTASVTSSSINP